MQSVSKEVAIKEVNSWLDAKRVRESVREKNKDSIDGLVESFESGAMSLNDENNEITYTLLFPVGDTSIKTLVFKPRMKHADFTAYANNLPKNDTRAFINAKIAALTGQNTGIINQIDHEDMRAIDDIAIFFM